MPVFRRGKKVFKIMEHLTVDQLLELREELTKELIDKGLNLTHLESLEEDIADRMIDETQDKYLHKVFKECEYKNKKGEVCGELDCQEHILNDKGVLVAKKSKRKVKFPVLESSPPEEDSE